VSSVQGKTKAGAIAWMCCLQYFVAEAVSIHAWPGYSLRRNYISDLGRANCDLHASVATNGLCSPLHSVMNASFMIQGCLVALGSALTWRLFPKKLSWLAALSLIGASGLGVLLVGFAPEDVNSGLHYLGAAENLLCCNLGMLAIGAVMRRSRKTPKLLSATTLGAGCIGSTALALLALHINLHLGPGGMERAAAYPFPLWLAGMGALLFKHRDAALFE